MSSMQLKNRVIIAAAGSGKSTFLIDEALLNFDKKTLLLTYTIENQAQLERAVIGRIGYIPPNIVIKGWFEFLLSDGIRPYQNYVFGPPRIDSLCYISGRSAIGIPKTKRSYYCHREKEIYPDKISELTCLCNEKSQERVVKRLGDIYDAVYIDEVQDLAGYDFDVLEMLFQSKLNILAVGDNRQATYVTNYSPKYKKFKGKNIVALFQEWHKADLCDLAYRTDCFRCIQSLCDFADALYPLMPKSESRNEAITDHDGLFIVKTSDLTSYIDKYDPQILRYSKTTVCNGYQPMNFAVSKGLTFNRVLIIPHGPIKKFLKSGNISHVEGSKEKFYVALTRARQSVAFLYDDATTFDFVKEFKV